MVQKKIETGKYHDPEEVLEQALELLEERDHNARLLAAIAFGDEAHSQRRVKPWKADSMKQLLYEAKVANRLLLPISDDIKP